MSKVRFVSEEVAGLRSFSPHVPGVLEFRGSLTVIVGPNGSGKTTLVEALRFAATGEMPYGKGEGFVNHPGEDTQPVHAYVRLVFTDIAGRLVRVQRNLILSRKVIRGGGHKEETRSNGVTISRQDETGNFISISNKIQDTNAELAHILGVSRAILKWVILCPQEDSLWPMSSPADLRKVFNELFDSERFDKLVKKLKEIKKAKTDDIEKTLKKELIYLKGNREQASRFRADLDEKRESVAAWETEVEQVEAQLLPARRDLRALDDRIHHLQTARVALAEKEAQLNSARKDAVDLRRSIRSPWTGTREELQDERAALVAGTAEKRRRLEAAEAKMRELKAQEQQLQLHEHQLAERHGQLRNRQQAYQKRQAERDADLTAQAKEGGATGVEQKRAGELLAWLKKQSGEAEAALESQRQNGDKELSALASERESEQRRLTQTETERGLHEAAVKEKRAEQVGIQRKLEAVASLCSEQKETEDRLAELDAELREVGSGQSLSESQMEAVMTEAKEWKTRTEGQLGRQEEKLKRAQGVLALRTELGMLEQAKEKAQCEWDSLPLGKVQAVLGKRPGDEQLRGEVESAKREAAVKRRECESAVSSLSARVEASRTSVGRLEQEKSRLERELTEQERRVASVVKAGSDPVEELEQLAEKLSLLARQRGHLAGQQALYKDFLSRAKKEKACPLCERGCTGKEKTDLEKRVEKALKGLPTEAETKRELETTSRRKSELESIRPALDELERLKNSAMPKKREELEEAKRKGARVEDGVQLPAGPRGGCGEEGRRASAALRAVRWLGSPLLGAAGDEEQDQRETRAHRIS